MTQPHAICPAYKAAMLKMHVSTVFCALVVRSRHKIGMGFNVSVTFSKAMELLTRARIKKSSTTLIAPPARNNLSTLMQRPWIENTQNARMGMLQLFSAFRRCGRETYH